GAFEQPPVADDARPDYLQQSSPEFAVWRGSQQLRIGDYCERLMECANEILAGTEICACLSTSCRVYLREQRCRNLNNRDSAHVHRGKKTGEVANNPSTESNHN